MITITEEILIKSDIQKVWSFLSDFEISLSINSFHKHISKCKLLQKIYN